MRTVECAIFGLALAVGPSGPTLAEKFSALEVAALPVYCRDALTFGPQYGGSPETRAYWNQRLGPVMAHIHHYCWALVSLQRARISTANAKPPKRYWYGSSIAGINYVIKYVDENFVLLPEMLTRKGEALTYLKQYAEAEQVLRKAIELKPDYWPAYVHLAESFIDRKNPDAAKDVLRQGLSRSDEKRVLQRMLDELDKS